MTEKQKDKDLITENSVVVAEREANGRTDRTMPDQAERSETHTVTEANPAALLPDDEINKFQSRWNAIQTGFVDEPRSAVEDADNLVVELMERLTDMFAEERSRLEDGWTSKDEISTEHLRLMLQRYRSFFHRLLSL